MENDFKETHKKTQAELSMLYEIGNAMHTTLNLEENSEIIVTLHFKEVFLLLSTSDILLILLITLVLAFPLTEAILLFRKIKKKRKQH